MKNKTLEKINKVLLILLDILYDVGKGLFNIIVGLALLMLANDYFGLKPLTLCFCLMYLVLRLLNDVSNGELTNKLKIMFKGK